MFIRSSERRMNYFNEAFGGFYPDKDKDAALKFSLCILALDSRMEELLQLVEGASSFGGIGGDPGWIIERREDGDIIGYEEWPDDARFRAYVSPDGYFLSYPEFFADQRIFFQYVKMLIEAYEQHHPKNSEIINRIKAVICNRPVNPVCTTGE